VEAAAVRTAEQRTLCGYRTGLGDLLAAVVAQADGWTGGVGNADHRNGDQEPDGNNRAKAHGVLPDNGRDGGLPPLNCLNQVEARNQARRYRTFQQGIDVGSH
jgi:hypothetical protein